jgi:hypothetical protein
MEHGIEQGKPAAGRQEAFLDHFLEKGKGRNFAKIHIEVLGEFNNDV